MESGPSSRQRITVSQRLSGPLHPSLYRAGGWRTNFLLARQVDAERGAAPDLAIELDAALVLGHGKVPFRMIIGRKIGHGAVQQKLLDDGIAELQGRHGADHLFKKYPGRYPR